VPQWAAAVGVVADLAEVAMGAAVADSGVSVVVILVVAARVAAGKSMRISRFYGRRKWKQN